VTTYEAHAQAAGTADATSMFVHWTRRHPRLTWAGLLTVLAVSTMFVRDVGTRPTSTASGTAIGLALVLFASVTFLILSHPGARHRRARQI
jgi:hypothetical protein